MWIWTRLKACFPTVSGRRRRGRWNEISTGCDWISIQQLEPRLVLTNTVVPAVAATPNEEYFLELINRARANPTAEAARLGIDLNEGLAPGTIPPGPRQPLALNADLQAAIEGHLSDELAHNYFSHTGFDGSTFQQRIEAAGYLNWIAIGENLAWEGTTGTVNLTQFVTDNYDNLFTDTSEPGRGHRINMLNGTYQEVGSAVQSGAYQGFNSVLVGNDFGAKNQNSFVTGVVYTDAAATNFYQVGEGLSGDTVIVTDALGNTYQTTSNAGGGYQIQLPNGSYTITFSGAGISTPITKSFTINSLNVDVDANTRTDIVPGGPPALSGTNPVNYQANASPVAIDSAILVTDPNRTTLATAKITISNFVAGQDVLGFVPNAGTMGNIALSTNANGVLTLASSGSTATLAQWQTALRAVTYSNSSGTPTTTTRNVTFVVNDGRPTNPTSNTLSTTVTVSVANTPPVLSAIEGTALAYNVLTPAVNISSTIQIADSDSANLAGATVKISSGYQNGEDLLSFANTAKITGTFNAATGTLTLSGSDTVANYQAALRAVKYQDTSSTPSIVTRTVSFQANDGSPTNNLSNIVTRNISVTGAPVVSGTTGPVTFVQGQAPVPMVPNLVLTHPNGLNIQSATVSFVNWENGDQVSLTNSFGLAQNFSANLATNTATLTLTGNDTLAHYQATLRSLLFSNNAGSPVTWLQRVATITVSDTHGNTGSATQNAEVNPVANAAPPAVSGTGPTVTYVQSASPITVAPNLVVTDNLNIYSATVTFTNWQGGDRLQFTNSFALQHTFAEDLGHNTATLTLTGFSSAANYQTTLRSVQFWTVAGSPVTWLQRIGTFTVTDQYSNSGSATQNVAVNPVANSAPPVISGTGAPVTYVVSSAPITIVPNLVVTDNLNIYSTTVAFTNWEPGDRLSFTNSFALQHTFVENLSTNTATLTLTGFDTAAHYQATLRSLQFWSVAGSPVTWLQRVATFTVTDLYSKTATATQNVEVNTVANSAPPVVSGTGGTVTYVQSGPAVSIVPNLVVTDRLNIYSATVSFVNWQPGDRLQFSNSFALQHNFVEDLNANTATLTITGFTTAANYQTTLRSLQFWTVSGSPKTWLARMATITVTDLNSNAGSATQRVVVNPVANSTPPSVTGFGGTVRYSKSAGPLSFAPNLVVTDSLSIYSATITFTNWQPGDRLDFVNSFALQHTLNEDFTANTATLTLTGFASAANYQTTLRSLQFYSVAGALNTTTRVATITVSDLYAQIGSATENIAVGA